MAEHSPAPFKAVHGWDAFIYIEDAQGRSVAAMQRRGPNAVANAHLFEAAPGLLKAAETSLELLEDMLGADCADGCECILHELREGVAKARGEASNGA